MCSIENPSKERDTQDIRHSTSHTYLSYDYLYQIFVNGTSAPQSGPHEMMMRRDDHEGMELEIAAIDACETGLLMQVTTISIYIYNYQCLGGL